MLSSLPYSAVEQIQPSCKIYEVFKVGMVGKFSKILLGISDNRIGAQRESNEPGRRFFARMELKMKMAFADMASLERGAIAKPDENQTMGNYWQQNPAPVPRPEIRKEIVQNTQTRKAFFAKIHNGEIGDAGGDFKDFLLIEIGGFALELQLVAQALDDPSTKKHKPLFSGNTDPNGINRAQATVGAGLNRAFCLVNSRFIGTKGKRSETLVARAFHENAYLDFGKRTVAAIMSGHKIYKYQIKNNLLIRFVVRVLSVTEPTNYRRPDFCLRLSDI